MKTLKQQNYLHVHARVRYWEDAQVNGDEDTLGTLIPCREGDAWCPIIHIPTGVITNWLAGTEADICYKVCDDGEYYLSGSATPGHHELKYTIDYVPSELLCHGDAGYGDYIILNIDKSGQIQNYTVPECDPEEWEIL